MVLTNFKYLVAEAPERCYGRNVMSQEMRKAIVDAHNKLRHNLAIGSVQRDAYHYDKRMPNASNMRAMKYDCESEQKALLAIQQDDCEILKPRIAFEDLVRNYGYINTTLPLYRAVKFLKKALVDMANADTEGVGCAVNFCSSSANNYYAVYCYYSAPHVEAGKGLYREGAPCSACPEGYQCYDDSKLCREKRF
ncbi:SCP-like protein [Teladorsagia circumcincta]|uniref:SCP-like protein n=1 Tax=Teladorsagia circumcincta TaxID=45464 RepID=A0A2G9UV92_TELCI|nr:SCP-like protein [Teladorsagia circumcincta]